MKCQTCSNPATVHLTDIVEGQKKEVHLCEACAEQGLGAESWLAATVEGRLRIDQRRGSVCCPRGHVLRVERVTRATVAAY